MRKYIYIFSALVAACLSACSNISEEERLIYVPPLEAQRNVLIEDFTGQSCVNCPNATIKIEELQELYGADHVISVAIHSGPFGRPEARPDGLMNETGQEYWNKWLANRNDQPIGIFNRSVISTDYTNWAKPVKELLATTTDVNIYLTAYYDDETDKVVVFCWPTGEKTRSAKLQVWLTEDNIVARQTMPRELGGGTKMDYVHNHVFRAAINGTWGEDIQLGAGVTNDGVNYEIDCNAKWNHSNLHVVAFVYTDQEVLQVVSEPVISE